jgi:RNA polymerase sigma factor (sigma-70 family)
MYDHYPDAETAISSAGPDRRDPPDRPAPPVHAPEIRATDGERLMRFRMHRDEAAFREVVETHAVLVWGVCWQVLRHREDVEDVFQATFLILARKCAAIRATDSAAGWLYRVAFRTALAARARRRRLGTEPLAVEPPASLEEQFASIERAEQVEALLEELHALGDRYRQPLVLCYLEGRSRQEAADELGVTMASVKGRLARGMRMLRTRLAGRGMALSTAAAVMASEMATAQASLATAPVAQTVGAATSFAWAALSTKTAAAKAAVTQKTISITPGAALLAKQGLLAMKYAAIVKPMLGLFAVGVTAGAIALAAAKGDGQGAGDGSGVDAAATTAVVDLFASNAKTGDGSAADQLAPNTFVAFRPDDEERLGLADVPAAPPQPTLTETSSGTLTINDGNALHFKEEGSGTLSIAGGELTVNDSWSAPANWTNGDDASANEPMSPPVQTQGPTLNLIRPQPTTAVLPSGGSLVVMDLERDHWKLKAKGLEKKANAQRKKLDSLMKASAVGPVERLEMEAEIELTQAEVSLCLARTLQLSETIDALRGDLQPTASTGVVFTPAPPLAAMPAAPAQPPVGSTYTTSPGRITVAPLAPPTAIVTGSPLVIGVNPQSPAQVGAPTLFEFTVFNVFDDDDENIELHIPMPPSWSVDQKTIATPPHIRTKVEGNKLIFSPVARLRRGEVLKYRVPFTPQRAGDAVLKVKAVSKQHPKGVEAVVGVRVFAKQGSTAEVSTAPAGGTTKIQFDGLAAINEGATPSIAGTPEASADLRTMIDELQRRNAELETRLQELEKGREAMVK